MVISSMRVDCISNARNTTLSCIAVFLLIAWLILQITIVFQASNMRKKSLILSQQQLQWPEIWITSTPSAHFLKTIKISKSTLINLTSFQYIINNELICQNEFIHMLTFVHSSPQHFAHRNAIRTTWGSFQNISSNNIRTIFLLAESSNTSLQKEIFEENEKFHDLIQGNFKDSYKNLTYKHVMGMKWVSEYCNNTKFVLKTDDDIFVNIFQLLTLLKKYKYKTQKLVVCNIWKRMKVIRDKRSKWFVSELEYKNNIYEPYCSGGAYIFTPDIAKDVYILASHVPFFWVDDVHVTGTLMRHLNIHYEHINKFFTFTKYELEKWLNQNNETKPLTLLVGPTGGNAIFMQQIWNKILVCLNKTESNM